MTTDRLEFFTPIVGRFVSGSLTEKRTKDKDNRDILPEKQKFEFGVAFPKADIWPFLTTTIYPYLATALGANQRALIAMSNWFSSLQGYSMKVADGDAPNRDGKVNENTVGQFVFYFSSSFAPKAVGPDPAFTEIDPSIIKRGWYVQVAGNILPNDNVDKPGIYLNGNIVRLIAEGDEIKGGIDAASAFQGTAAPLALPAGAKPLGSTSGFTGGAPAQIPMAPVGLPGHAPAGLPGHAPAGLPGHAPAGLPGHAPAGLPGAPVGIASPTNTPHTAILAGPGAPGFPVPR